jgi:hypothetical protein
VEFIKENMDELDLSLQRGPGHIATDTLIYCDNYVHRCVILPKHSHPERPILGIRGILVQLRSHYIAPFDDDVFFSFVGESNRKKSRKRGSMARFIAPASDGESSSSGGTMPMRRQGIPPLTIKDRYRATYAKESRTKLLLLYNEDSDSSELSITSR